MHVDIGNRQLLHTKGNDTRQLNKIGSSTSYKIPMWHQYNNQNEVKMEKREGKKNRKKKRIDIFNSFYVLII